MAVILQCGRLRLQVEHEAHVHPHLHKQQQSGFPFFGKYVLSGRQFHRDWQSIFYQTFQLLQNIITEAYSKNGEPVKFDKFMSFRAKREIFIKLQN